MYMHDWTCKEMQVGYYLMHQHDFKCCCCESSNVATCSGAVLQFQTLHNFFLSPFQFLSWPASRLLSCMAGLSVSSEVTTLPDCDLDKQDWGGATGHGMSLLFCFVSLFFFLSKRWKIPPFALAGAKRQEFLAKNESEFTCETLWLQQKL